MLISHSQMSVLFFDKKCVLLELYKSNWCVIGDTLSVSHYDSLKFINFDTPGLSFDREIVRNYNFFKQSVSFFTHSGKMTQTYR